MRAMAEVLVTVLLVGCMMAAVVVAGEQACDGPYQGRKPKHEEFVAVLLNYQAWLKSDDRKPDDERRANLCRADLEAFDLQGANLNDANLQGADLSGAQLQGAILHRAKL